MWLYTSCKPHKKSYKGILEEYQPQPGSRSNGFHDFVIELNWFSTYSSRGYYTRADFGSWCNQLTQHDQPIFVSPYLFLFACKVMILSAKRCFSYCICTPFVPSLTIFVHLTLGGKSKETQNETMKLVPYVTQTRLPRLTQCLFIVQSLVDNQTTDHSLVTQAAIKSPKL